MGTWLPMRLSLKGKAEVCAVYNFPWSITYWLYFLCLGHVGWRCNDPSPDYSGEVEGQWSVHRSVFNVHTMCQGTLDLESHWLAEKLAYLGRSLSGYAVWRLKACRNFPRLKSDPKAEGRRKPMGKTPFIRECSKALRNLSGSNGLSRPRKELYRELVVGSASDSLSSAVRLDGGGGPLPVELGARFGLLEQFQVLAHQAAYTERVVPSRLEFQCRPGWHARLSSLRQWFRRNGWEHPLLRATSPVMGSRRGVDDSHRTQAARAARRWLRRRERLTSVSR